jgi:hypothetical protein
MLILLLYDLFYFHMKKKTRNAHLLTVKKYCAKNILHFRAHMLLLFLEISYVFLVIVH